MISQVTWHKDQGNKMQRSNILYCFKKRKSTPLLQHLYTICEYMWNVYINMYNIYDSTYINVCTCPTIKPFWQKKQIVFIINLNKSPIDGMFWGSQRDRLLYQISVLQRKSLLQVPTAWWMVDFLWFHMVNICTNVPMDPSWVCLL